MMARMSNREFNTWAAILKNKPPGDRLVAAAIYNVNRNPATQPYQFPDEILNKLHPPSEREQDKTLDQIDAEVFGA